MRAILATIGTDGDVFPHIGLGATLHARGHQVILAAPEPYRENARCLGLDFLPLATVAEVGRMLADPDLWHPLRSGMMMARWGAPMIPRQYDAIANLVGQPNTVLIANPGLLAARLVQETMGVPTVSLLLQPGLVPSCSAPPKMPGGLTIPPWLPHPLRRLYWLGVDAVGYALIARSLNRIRKGLRLPPVRRLFRWWLSLDRVIGLFPNWYAASQPDWPPQLRLAGFGRYDGAQQELPEDVRVFCETDSPPIAFTLGTGMKHAAGFFRAAVATCEGLGARGLFLSKYPEIIPVRLPSSVRHCNFAPFRKLLPLCRAIVHHGGIGTTAAALEAGCPQLILPLAWDQLDNASRVDELGVGKMLKPRQRSQSHMIRALAGLGAPKIAERCRMIANRAAQQEDGFGIAAAWVEELAGAAKASSLPLSL
jgi:UDP:flavonoid glycosyltransferase YjiC (YdhE family)